MVITIVPVAMVIIGVLAFALSNNGKITEFGKALFWAGLFAFAFANAGKVITL